MKNETDVKWVIYRKILNQNSRWKIILLLKNNFGRLNKIWVQFDHWIMILTLEK